MVTFLPMTLLQQLQKVLNLFYILNGCLQTIPAISTISPLASLIPVIFVILVGIVLEGIAEYRRYCSDAD
jgi:phospholipid-transporting ATPase